MSVGTSYFSVHFIAVSDTTKEYNLLKFFRTDSVQQRLLYFQNLYSVSLWDPFPDHLLGKQEGTLQFFWCGIPCMENVEIKHSNRYVLLKNIFWRIRITAVSKTYFWVWRIAQQDRRNKLDRYYIQMYGLGRVRLRGYGLFCVVLYEWGCLQGYWKWCKLTKVCWKLSNCHIYG